MMQPWQQHWAGSSLSSSSVVVAAAEQRLQWRQQPQQSTIHVQSHPHHQNRRHQQRLRQQQHQRRRHHHYHHQPPPPRNQCSCERGGPGSANVCHRVLPFNVLHSHLSNNDRPDLGLLFLASGNRRSRSRCPELLSPYLLQTWGPCKRLYL